MEGLRARRWGAFLLIVSILLLVRPPVRPCGAAGGADTRAHLVKRHQALFARFGDLERGRLSLEAMREEARPVIDSLEAMHMDSLAADACGLLCDLYSRTGDWPVARDAAERGVRIARRGGVRTLEADRLLDLGVLDGLEGDYEAAVARMAELIPVYESLGTTRTQGVCWANIAYAYLRLGRIPEALAANARALPLARGSGNQFGVSSAHSTRSQLLRLMGRAPEALVYADSALAIAEREGWQLTQGTALAARADALHDLRRYDDSINDLDRALDARIRSADSTYIPGILLSKGQVLLRMARPRDCATLMNTWIPRFEDQGDAPHVFAARALLGQSLVDDGKPGEAEPVLREALEAFEDYRFGLGEDESRAGIYLHGGEAYAALARCALARGDRQEAWRLTERGRGAMLRKLMQSGSPEVPEPGARDAFMVSGLESLQRLLADGKAALIQYGDPRLNPLAAFLITPDDVLAVELGSLDPILADARTAGDLIASDAGDAAVAPILARLAERLLDPIIPAVPRETERLILIPPSVLFGLPFEVLPIRDVGGRCTTLGERYPLSYALSASILLYLAARTAPRDGGIVVIADPALDTIDVEPAQVPSQLRALRRTPLPHARQEASAAAGRTGLRWVGAEATEERATSPGAREASVLHFATHAVISPFSPERSGLLLASGGDPAKDGILTAAEVQAQTLHADIVTLSGCATGTGLPVVGEGSYGLPRSFLLAGARSVVASVWKVEDRAASAFMRAFYEALREGRPRDDALRKARSRMKASGFGLRDRAAFVLFGVGQEPVGALTGERPSPSTTLLVGAPVAALALMFAMVFLTRRRRSRKGRALAG